MFGLRYREDLQTGQTSIIKLISSYIRFRDKGKLTVLIPTVDPSLGRHGDDLELGVGQKVKL